MAKSGKSATTKRAPKQIVSGAVGGPATGAGLTYQADVAIKQILELCAKFLSFPLTDPTIQIEPRPIDDERNSTRWDLGLDDGQYIETKLNPSRQDVLEWLNRTRSLLHTTTHTQSVLIFGRCRGSHLAPLEGLLRIANEVGADEQRFWATVDHERIPGATELFDALGAKPRESLQRMKVLDLSVSSLADAIDLYCRVLAGQERAKDFRNFLQDRVLKAVMHRSTLNIRQLIDEAGGSHGIRLTAIPGISMGELQPEVRDALFLLSVCPVPMPEQVIANAVCTPLDTLRSALSSPIIERAVMFENNTVRMIPSPTRLPEPQSALCEQGLRTLLVFIRKNRYHAAGRDQVRNAIALAQIVLKERPLVVARMFIDLDKAAKGTGDKHLVLNAAEMAVSAAHRVRPPQREAVEGEAQAMICGSAWALQRIGHLQQALTRAQDSLDLGKNIGYGRNTAYCHKCIGRLYRMMAEETLEQSERDRLIEKSAKELDTAIELFCDLSDFGNQHQEVGDCYSLLARTWLVAGKLEDARECARKAADLISEPDSKDYLDLLILQGELEATSNPGASLMFYDEVLKEPYSDSEKSEITARAYFGRAKSKLALGRKPDAQRDFEQAKKHWVALEEDENAARATWEILKLQATVPPSAVSVLSKEKFSVRIAVVEAHRTRMEGFAKTYHARRSEPGEQYWRQLVLQARERATIESHRW